MSISRGMVVIACVLAPWLTSCASETTCGTGTSECNGACIATMDDPANCGACGNACDASQTCVAGACVAQCSGGEARCDGTCVDTLSSSADCGGCDQPCATGEVCFGGGCSSCGNGVWEPGEQCDDGNNVSGDGCTDGCAYEGPPGSITFTFTGEIVRVLGGSDLGGFFAVGDPFIGRYTIDPTAPDQNSGDPTTGSYQLSTAGYGVALSVDGHLFATDPTNVQFDASVWNNLGSSADAYGWNNLSLAPPGTTAASAHLELLLIDPSMTALSSDAQPVTPLDLSHFVQSSNLGSGLYVTTPASSELQGVVLTLGY